MYTYIYTATYKIFICAWQQAFRPNRFTCQRAYILLTHWHTHTYSGALAPPRPVWIDRQHLPKFQNIFICCNKLLILLAFAIFSTFVCYTEGFCDGNVSLRAFTLCAKVPKYLSVECVLLLCGRPVAWMRV